MTLGSNSARVGAPATCGVRYSYMRAGPKMSAPCTPVRSRSFSSDPLPTANSMPPWGVAYVKILATYAVPAASVPPATGSSGITLCTRDRQMSPPIEWATRKTRGAPVLVSTSLTSAKRSSAARSIENSSGCRAKVVADAS